MRRFTLLLLLFLSIAYVARSQTTPLVLNNLGRITLPVDGPWQFHTGDDFAWASPAFDDSAWQPIQVGRSWEGQGHRDYTGFAWYRPPHRHSAGHACRPESGALSAQCRRRRRGLLEWQADWQLRKGASASGLVSPAFPQTYLLGPARSGVLAIRVWSAPIIFLNFAEQGGLSGMPRIGTAEGAAALQTADRYRWLRGNQFNLAVCLLSAIIGLLAFAAWLRDRSRWMLFWLAIPMLKPMWARIVFGLPGISTFRLGYGSIGQVVGINDVAIWFLLLYLLDLRSNTLLVKWSRVLAFLSLGFGLIDTMMVLLDWTRLFPRQFVYIDVASTIPVELLELYVLVIVAFALRKRLDAARWMLTISAVLAALQQGINDISGLGNRWTHWTLHLQLYRTLFTVAASPINLITLVNLFLLVSILYAAWRYSVEQNQRQSAIEQEFRSAQEIQQILIPEVLPAVAGYAVTSAYYPAQEVGGDFFQIIPLASVSGQEQGAIIVLGDVSGKGLKAAMTVSLLVGAIHSTVEITQDPAQILAALNRRLHGRMQGGFATCLVLHFDASGSGTLANTGHLPPFLNGAEFPLPPALPLGLLPEADYETTALHLVAHDRLTLYTDGLLEARNLAGDLFGFARIAEISDNTSEQIARSAQQFGQDDDITVLTLTLTPAAAALG